MSFERSRLRRGEWIVGVGGVVLLASTLLLPWYGDSRSIDGWNALSHFRWLLVLTLLLAGALLFFSATRRAPAIPVTISLFVAVVGGACAAWLLYRVAIDPVAGRKAGGWVGLAGAVAIAYGGLSATRRAGIAPKDAPAVATVDPWAQRGS